jgi:hypothetical protein
MICRSLLFLLPLATQPQASRQPETAALSWIENHEGEITALSDKLWEQAETAHEEARTVKLLTSRLEEDGIETGTRFELQLLSRTGPWLINQSFSRLLHAALGRDEAIRYTPEELRLGRALGATLAPAAEPVFRSQLLPLEFSDRPVPISDDTAEASWLVPRAGFLIACYPSGLPSHSWQWTAAGKSRFAHRGMLRATRALVRTASRLFTDPEALREIREEFERDPRRSGYRSPLPESLGPFDYLRPAKR